MGKLPYISGKRLYAAVMGACSYIRETGYFNKAISYYAKKYDVREDDIAKYVRIAQGNGQKAKNKTSPKRKYKWFVIEYSWGDDYNNTCYFMPEYAEYKVAKGMSLDNVIGRMCEEKNGKNLEYASIPYTGRVKEFETEHEAMECYSKWRKSR